MSLNTTQPTNTNFLPPTGFKFVMYRTPNVDYFCQKFNFPGLALNETKNFQTPFNRVITAGDHITFDNFSLEFKIDEGMYNYLEIYNWIISLGFPDNFDQYKEISKNKPGSGIGIMSDADVIILDSSMNPNVKATFYDIIPVSLSGFILDSTRNDINYVTAVATFKYREYTFERI